MAFPRLAWRLRWALLAPVVAAMVAAMPLFIFALIAGPVAERELVVTLGLAALVGTLAAIVTAWWLRRVLVAPLDAVLAGVERLASGDFAFRLQQSLAAGNHRAVGAGQHARRTLPPGGGSSGGEC